VKMESQPFSERGAYGVAGGEFYGLALHLGDGNGSGRGR